MPRTPSGTSRSARPARRAGALATLALLTVLLLGVAFVPLAGAGAASSRAPTTSIAAPGPALGPRAAAPHPASGHVNPFLLIQHEPAPMGVADFGVTGPSGNVGVYSYTTPLFQGNVRIDSMLTNDGSGGHAMTFQLNTVMVLNSGTQNFSYWIQNVPSIDSSTNAIGWVDNIWNLSSPTAALATGEISGNGSVNNLPGLSWYADVPGSGYPGNDITLSYPTNLSVRSITSTIAGIPHVGFYYNDGYGWVCFDNVSFNRANGWTNYGFLVDGFAYAPIGIFYDAEWDYAGSGQGQHNVASDLNMSLDRWNGHNLEAVPNAWNFGSDTAESLDNVVSALGAPTANGSLYAHLTNGSGTLGVLYNQTDTGTLDVAAPSVPTGAILLNDTPTDYRGGRAVFTLAPGSYTVAIESAGRYLDSAVVAVVAGATTHLLLPAPRYNLSFGETGLPAGASWSVNVSGDLLNSTGPWLNTTEKNGSYGYAVVGVPGFAANSYYGSVTVEGADRAVAITFSSFNYSVEFAEVGLPDGTPWWVTIAGTTVAASGSTASVSLANGTYSYTIATVNTYIANPPDGTLTVDGGTGSATAAFVLHLGNLAGNVTPASATVLVDGAPVTTVQGAFNLSKAPAIYAVEAYARGYATAFYNISVTPGNTSVLPIVLAPAGAAPAQGAGGLSMTAAVVLLVVVAAGAFGAVAAVALRQRRRRS